MNEYYGNSALWLIPALPALAALAIFVLSKKITGDAAARIAIVGVALSFASVLFASRALVSIPTRVVVNHAAANADHVDGEETHFLTNPVLTERLWRWLDTNPGGIFPNAPTIRADAGLWFDRMTMVFALVISGVGLLIHIYSAGYMRGDEGQRRFFGFLSLFVAAMLILVTADNAFFMLLGWEGVGACSFALIGHYYQVSDNALAALKAFLVTRFGDVFLILGVIMLGFISVDGHPLNLVSYYAFDTPGGGFAALARATHVSSLGGMAGPTAILVVGLLLLGGAAGKSAQLPFQAWLPDAMAGPTPVSALIHAATMVTAGVYLIARFHGLYAHHAGLMGIVALMGVLTALYGATCALVQTDIKRILAYSTISQIGYMMLGLGAGAFSLGLFHFFTHAFYKALLFLGAGTIIHALHGEQNIHNMGGLRGRLAAKPGGLDWTFYAFVIGAAALAGFPLTSGYFSKDAVLWSTLASARFGGWWLYAIGLFTAFLTAVYSFRLVFIVFFGEPRREDIHVHPPEPLLVFPLVTLAGFALVVGFLNLPHLMSWEKFLGPAVGELELAPSATAGKEVMLLLVSAIVSLAGIATAYVLYGPKAARLLPQAAMDDQAIVTSSPHPYRSALANHAFHGWGADQLILGLLARPYRKISMVTEFADRRLVSGVYDLGAMIFRGLHYGIVFFQNGRPARYALVMLCGAAILALVLVSPSIYLAAGGTSALWLVLFWLFVLAALAGLAAFVMPRYFARDRKTTDR